ncbi:MAG: cupin domain-containing protein [Sneathiella sp.]
MNILHGSFILFITALLPLTCSAQKASSTNIGADKNGVHRALLSTIELTNMKGFNFTSLTVELKPGVVVPSHQHEAFVFVYVLEGQVVSQINKQAAVVYTAGDHWLEQPGDSHSKTQNPNEDKAAKLLVIFVARDSAKLMTSGEVPK